MRRCAASAACAAVSPGTPSEAAESDVSFGRKAEADPGAPAGSAGGASGAWPEPRRWSARAREKGPAGRTQSGAETAEGGAEAESGAGVVESGAASAEAGVAVRRIWRRGRGRRGRRGVGSRCRGIAGAALSGVPVSLEARLAGAETASGAGPALATGSVVGAAVSAVAGGVVESCSAILSSGIDASHLGQGGEQAHGIAGILRLPGGDQIGERLGVHHREEAHDHAVVQRADEVGRLGGVHRVVDGDLALQLVRLVRLHQLQALLELGVELVEFRMRAVERSPLGVELVLAFTRLPFALGHGLLAGLQGLADVHHSLGRASQRINADCVARNRRLGRNGGNRWLFRHRDMHEMEAHEKSAHHEKQAHHTADGQIPDHTFPAAMT